MSERNGRLHLYDTPEPMMSPERAGRLRLIGVTALVTFVITFLGTFAVAVIVSRRPPPTPRIAAPPKTITVTVYPSSTFVFPIRGFPPTEIPAGEYDAVMRLLTPDTYYEGGVNDWITPLIAEVVITHDGQPDTRLLVRWTGKNPAAISLDGRLYFYGVPHADVHDGGLQLISLVQRLNEKKLR